MLVPNHPIFRNNAVKHYMQSREKDTLPRFISLPIALFLWILLGLLLVVGLLSWYEQIPTYATGKGAVLNSKYAPPSARQDAVAVAFFSLDQASNLHVGQAVSVYLESFAQPVKGVVLVVDHSVSPDDALHRYGLGSSDASLITQPSAAVIVRLEHLSPSQYAGSSLTISLLVGSRRIISLLPGIGSLLGK
jgi:hypothetical protein